jgi:hypothetical protein
MPILTDQEACDALHYTDIDQMPAKVKSILLPGIDCFIKDATGKDWGTLTDTYTAIDPTAKTAAMLLLMRWFEDSQEIGKAGIGVIGLLSQLQAKYSQESQASQ